MKLPYGERQMSSQLHHSGREDRGERSWRRFTIRSLLLAAVGVAAFFGWLRTELDTAREQEESALRLAEIGGCIVLDYQVDNGRPKHDASLPRAVQEATPKDDILSPHLPFSHRPRPSSKSSCQVSNSSIDFLMKMCILTFTDYITRDTRHPPRSLTIPIPRPSNSTTHQSPLSCRSSLSWSPTIHHRTAHANTPLSSQKHLFFLAQQCNNDNYGRGKTDKHTPPFAPPLSPRKP